MFVFKKEQVTYDFGDIRVGGNPGEQPTTLIGGLFFKGQPIVENTKEGFFNEELTKEWISTGNEMSQLTGHPLIIQVYGRTSRAMEKHISWLSEHFDGPFMFESTSAKARKRGIEFCDEVGLHNRAIYNSINLSTKAEELELLRDSKLHMAVVLGWSPRATTLPERMNTVRDMIELSKEHGITKMLVDPATMPVGAGYGLDYRTILAIKSEFGLPTCLAPHNAVSAWSLLKRNEFADEPSHQAAVIASTVVSQIMATDSIMYGSMIRSKEVFAAVSLIANAVATAAAESNRALGIEREYFDPPVFE